MKSPGLYSMRFVSTETLTPRAQTKIAMSEILAARIRMLARESARKARVRAAKEVGNG
jgi:hypothetical protein